MKPTSPRAEVLRSLRFPRFPRFPRLPRFAGFRSLLPGAFLGALAAGCGGGGGGGGGAPPGGDPDPAPVSVTIEGAAVLEGDGAGAAAIVFTVRLSAASAREVRVDYSTANGSAAAGLDYQAASGTLRFPAGTIEKVVRVEVIADSDFEADETLFVRLAGAVNSVLGEAQAAGVIRNDDPSEPPPDEEPPDEEPPVEEPPVEEPGLDERPANSSCVFLERPAHASGLKVEEVFESIVVPGVFLTQAPGDNSRWFLVDRNGLVHVFANDPGVSRRETFLDIRDRAEETNDGGLLSLAFHPLFAANGEAFVFYNGAEEPPRTRLSRFTSTDGGRTLDPDSEEVLFSITQHNEFHKGGQARFGPDGYLYVAVGDAGGSYESQDTSTLAGKLLRLDVDGGIPYGIPPDNPFAAGGGRPEIFAWGFRNPWGWSFDRETGDIWLGDVGHDTWEEVNRVVRGGNYGWPGREASHCHQPDICDDPDFIDPVVEFTHEEGNAVVGGFVYRGALIPKLFGTYLFADWGSGKIWGIFHDEDGKPVKRVLLETGVTILSFAEDQDGEIYIASSKQRTFRLLPATVTGSTSFPERLSDAPCVDPSDPSRPSAGMIPFAVNAPLFTGNAEKERFIALPDGETVSVLADGSFDFPVGTVFLKHFRLGARLIETRIFARHADGEWGGYSYEWNDDETDATLLLEAKTKVIDGETWTYPSRAQCLACHATPSRAIGFQPLQLNRPFTYPTTGRSANQLRTFEHIGLFDRPLAAPPEELPALPSPEDPAAPLAARARAYLHGNCANCHHPENALDVSIDLRFETPFAGTGLCDALPKAGDLEVEGARIVAPGDPTRSVLALRLGRLGAGAMPPIGKSLVDETGTALIEHWITALAGCE